MKALDLTALFTVVLAGYVIFSPEAQAVPAPAPDCTQVCKSVEYGYYCHAFFLECWNHLVPTCRPCDGTNNTNCLNALPKGNACVGTDEWVFWQKGTCDICPCATGAITHGVTEAWNPRDFGPIQTSTIEVLECVTY